VTYVEIKTFREAIMYEMQRSQRTTLTFGTIWSICGKVSINLIPPCDPQINKKEFIQRLMDDVRWLGNHQYVRVQYVPFSNRVNFITLMSKGEKYLKESIFTHQDRMAS